MPKIMEFLQTLNDIGFWDMLTFAVATIGVMSLLLVRKKRISQFSVHFTYFFGTDYANYPNVVCLEVRNLMDSPVVISRPNFRFRGGLMPGNNAHGNSATGDYEIKFREVDTKGEIQRGFSYASMMLRHRGIAFSFIPIDDGLTEEQFLAMLNHGRWWHKLGFGKGLGDLYLNVAILREDKIDVVRMKVPLLTTHRHNTSPYLGGGALPS